MPPARVDLDVVTPVERIDRAVAAGDRAEVRLLLAQPELEAPVEALAVRAGRVLEPEPAADVGDLGVGEIGHEVPERIRCPRGVRVREGDHVAGRLADRAVLSGDLPAARAVEQADARLAGGDGLDELVRPVGRRVGGDDDLQAIRRVVERQQVVEPPLDHGLLVVGGDDDADRRLGARIGRDGRVAGHGPAPPPRAGSRRVSRRARRASPRRAPSPRPRGECSYARAR